MTNATTQNESKPISDRQLAANLANAQRSTGPKTAEGKAKSSRNALKHGLAATMVDAPGLDPDVVQKRMDAWTKLLNPQGDEVENVLVAMAVRASFRLEGCVYAQGRLIAEAEREPAEGVDDNESDKRNSPAELYKLMLRYEMQTERMLSKLVRDLRKRAKIATTEATRPRPTPAQTKPISVPNEPILPTTGPTKTDVAELKSIFLDIFATPAKPAESAKDDLKRRMADRFGSTRPR